MTPQKEVDAWNARYPVGTDVIVTMQNGMQIRTLTTAPASVLSGHAAVAWCHHIRGCYLLSRVRATENPQ